MKVYAQKYSEYAMTLDSPKSWSVHSVFENGFNLISDQRLLFIGTEKNGTLPFAIHLSARDIKAILPLIKKGQTFTREHQAWLALEIPCTISLQYAGHYQTKLEPTSSLDKGQYQALQEAVKKSAAINGFDQPLATIDWSKQRFGQALFSTEPAQQEEAIRYFIGRGKGLTPSGDDLLLGILAVHHQFGLVLPSFLTTLAQIVTTENCTTDVSKAYLKHAIKGEFSSSILQLMKGLSINPRENMSFALQQVLAHGHTSGADTITGLLLGLYQLVERENKQK
ncbi:DUF2877 domain-containing protein [Isobaculum melis]|uniref:DUF2877 domain-containing protein n=1 Tax=Isobaculum melis TaxID=142588 RepID=A0A1H9PUN7_9LACT|nr:DUF2877 domain-containing protein [Isobaculum melis]SER51830.1 Protein of unknown function [Isobaculum melis]